MSFLKSITNQSKKHDFPFDHWEYQDALSDGAIKEIIDADIPDVKQFDLNYDGTRAIDGGAAEFREGNPSGGKAIKFRCFITKENASNFPHLVKFINELQSKEVHEKISKMHPMIELLQSVKGKMQMGHCKKKNCMLLHVKEVYSKVARIDVH